MCGSHRRGYPAKRANADRARPERDAGEHEREPAERAAPKRSPRKTAPYASAIGGMRYVTSDAYAAPGAGDHPEEEEVRERRSRHAERDDRADLLPAGRRVRRLHDPGGSATTVATAVDASAITIGRTVRRCRPARRPPIA